VRGAWSSGGRREKRERVVEEVRGRLVGVGRDEPLSGRKSVQCLSDKLPLVGDLSVDGLRVTRQGVGLRGSEGEQKMGASAIRLETLEARGSTGIASSTT
jgi:hypothetical protein